VSLNTIMSTAASGLSTAQTQLRVVSDNVANVNTPGYVRKIVDQQSTTVDGVGVGVDVARVRLASDRFLQAASLAAAGEAARAGVKAELYDRVQGLFGDPTGESGFLAQIDRLFAAFQPLAEDATSSPLRQDALFRAEQLFQDAARVAGDIQRVRTDADGRIASAVEKVNGLLKDIEALNVEISRGTVVGRDVSGAEAVQAQLIDTLSTLMDVKVTARNPGGVNLRTGDGMVLVGDGAATLEYTRAGEVAPETAFDEVWLIEPRGERRSLMDHLKSGEILGLVELRDQDAPRAALRLAELTSRIADELNRAHNAASAVPPPNSLTGRETGLSLDSALAGFAGRTQFAIVGLDGRLVRKVEVDFSTPGQISVDGGPATARSNFLTAVNAALGADGSLAFTGGVLSFQANGATNGVVVAEGSPASANAGRGFSHFFGLNDLVRSDRIAQLETGLRAGDAHGFGGAGQSLTFRLTNPAGARVRDLTVAVPATGDVTGLLALLNDPTTGVGRWGTFDLDAQGVVAFTPNPGTDLRLSVIEDKTSNPQGVGMAEFFNLGDGARMSRADGFSIRTDVARDASRIALAKFDTAAAVNGVALSRGDGRGALALADAGQRTTQFAEAGGAAGGSLSVARYAAELAGDVGQRAAAHGQRKEATEALLKEAKDRRASFEGVNLDEELIKLTTFQQAFNASSRMIQAAREMYDVLLNMV
jgi:flagellar hook-associated protein 1 FlgK